MSDALFTRVARAKVEKWREKLVLFELACHSVFDGSDTASISMLSQSSGLPDGAIKTALAGLQKQALIAYSLDGDGLAYAFGPAL